MELTELARISSAALSVPALRDHLRLGSGFVDDSSQDPVLETYMRAAVVTIETITKRILLNRNFEVTFNTWRLEKGAQVFPVSNITQISSFAIVDENGTRVTVPAAEYGLVMERQRPRMFSKTGGLPKIPENGFAEVVIVAGYAHWGKIPTDLQQAVLILSAHFYENRGTVAEGGQMPQAVYALLEPYRRVRLGWGS